MGKDPAMETIAEVTLKNGRRLAVHRIAAGSGPPVVLCHAAPGSGRFDPDPDQTCARDVTLLSVDRPGYGGSTPVGPDEWATVGSAADDLAEVLDQLGTGPVGVAGWSAGGRVALALAARRPDLVSRLVLLATPAPDEEVPWIPPEYRAALAALAAQPPGVVHEALAAQLAAVVPADPHSPEALGLLGGGPADDLVRAEPGARDRLGGMFAGAFAQGAAGMAADIAGYCLRPWGFEPAEVAAKTLLLYGDEDPVAGPEHGRWWQRKIPDARLEEVPAAGHLLVVPMWHRVLAHLAPAGRATR
jgi:pimeloyl-ACP methyl ester carboxylesterase